MTPTIVPHVLCGGFGTRLWPMSREAFPKQFVPLIDGRSLLTCTLERAAQLGARLVCIGNAEHRFLVDAAFGEIDAGVRQSAAATGRPLALKQILEPVGRNTAAAMACAALLAEPDELLLFLPADHFIPDAAVFAATITQGVAELRNHYGTGHGKVAGAKGLQSRHAKLAVGAASTLAVFLAETHNDRRS